MDELKKQIEIEKQQYIKQYQRAYKELQIECKNLKELIDTVDPLNIDFNQKIKEINNIKEVCEQLHYRIIQREFKY